MGVLKGCRLWHLGIAALVMMPGISHAGSRFEAGDAVAVQARQHLDFIIVVPPFVKLTLAPSLQQQLTLATEVGSSVPVAHSNAGTVAIGPVNAVSTGPLRLGATETAVRSNAAVNYTIAVP